MYTGIRDGYVRDKICGTKRGGVEFTGLYPSQMLLSNEGLNLVAFVYFGFQRVELPRRSMG